MRDGTGRPFQTRIENGENLPLLHEIPSIHGHRFQQPPYRTGDGNDDVRLNQTAQLGRVPRRGESVAVGPLVCTVMLTRGGAVRWFKVTRAAAADTAA